MKFLTSYKKSTLRTIKKHYVQMFLLFFITLVSAIFSFGVGSLPKSIQKSYISLLEENNVADYYIKSFNLNDDIRTYIESSEEIIDYEYYFNYDFKNSIDEISRVYIKDLNKNLNTLTLIEGEYPKSSTEVLVNYGNGERKKYNVDDVIKLEFNLNEHSFYYEVKVSGVVNSPLYTSNMGERSFNDYFSFVDNIIYFDKNLICDSFPLNALKENEVAIKVFQKYYQTSSFEKKYLDFEEKLKDDLGTNETAVLNIYFYSLSSRGFRTLVKKMSNLSMYLPVFFVFVSSIVLGLSLSRIIKDERSDISCLILIGEPKWKIIFKYLYINTIPSILASFVGGNLGVFIIPSIIFPVVKKAYLT